MNLKKIEIIKLLRSGNFTIAYHDNGYCCLYKGKMEYDNLPEEGEVAEFEGLGDGYIPIIVETLVNALKGKVVSI